MPASARRAAVVIDRFSYSPTARCMVGWTITGTPAARISSSTRCASAAPSRTMRMSNSSATRRAERMSWCAVGGDQAAAARRRGRGRAPRGGGRGRGACPPRRGPACRRSPAALTSSARSIATALAGCRRLRAAAAAAPVAAAVLVAEGARAEGRRDHRLRLHHRLVDRGAGGLDDHRLPRDQRPGGVAGVHGGDAEASAPRRPAARARCRRRARAARAGSAPSARAGPGRGAG